MRETSFMAEALLPLHHHWYLSYALVVAGLFLGGAVSIAFFKATPKLLPTLNRALLMVLLLAGGYQVGLFFYNVFQIQAGTWYLNRSSIWSTSLGEFYLLLYHTIGTWMGLLFFWSYFRKSTFFTLLMAVLVNIHALVDASLAVDWWLADFRIGYELATYSAIRIEPSILIREWSIGWILVGVLIQIAILGGTHFYATNRRST